MTKLFTYIAAMSLTVMMQMAVSATPFLPSSQDDPDGTCGQLILAGDKNPPDVSAANNNIDDIQACLDHCNQLYQSYYDQNQYDNMFSGINYCRTSLIALYHQMLFQINNSSLNPTTNASSQEQASSNDADVSIPPMQQSQPLTSPPPAAPETNKSKSGGINWF